MSFMKKLFFSVAVLFAAVAGYNCYNNSNASDDEMSDLMKANIEALSSMPDHYKQRIWIRTPMDDGTGHVCTKGGPDTCL